MHLVRAEVVLVDFVEDRAVQTFQVLGDHLEVLVAYLVLVEAVLVDFVEVRAAQLFPVQVDHSVSEALLFLKVEVALLPWEVAVLSAHLKVALVGL